MCALAAATVVVGTVALTTSCDGVECPDFESPCPEPIELADTCEQGECEIDGEPTRSRCGPSSCTLKRGEVLSVPVNGSFEIAGGNELKILATTASGCLGENLRPEDLKATLDGVEGVAEWYMANIVVRWDPLPTDPARLEISYTGTDNLECAALYLSLIDLDCTIESPGPSGCIPQSQ